MWKEQATESHFEFFGPKDKEAMAARHRRSTPMIAVNAEIIAVVDLHLRVPGRSADEPAAHRRHRVHLKGNGSIRLETRLFDNSPGPSNIGKHEKHRFIPVFKMSDAIASRKQLVKGDAGQHGQGQRFPFVPCRSSREAKRRESVEMSADAPVER